MGVMVYRESRESGINPPSPTGFVEDEAVFRRNFAKGRFA